LALNRILCEEVLRAEFPNPSPKSSPSLSFDQKLFREGLRVASLEDDYPKGLYLGDMGFVTKVRPDLLEIESDFKGRLISHSLEELRKLSPSYALRAKEAYGATAPAVVLVLPKGAERVVTRPLLYASASRALSLLVIIGHPSAYAGVLKNKGEEKIPK
jgi:ATP-dependent exoDNAse (exonuclease V) alpha subunit